MSDDIQLDLNQLGWNQPTKPLEAPKTPDTANPLVSFFQGLGSFPGGVVRGAQSAAADVGTAVGANDWAKATQDDVNRSEPDLTGRPFRQAFNSVAEGIGVMAAPIAATLAVGAALTPPGEVAGATALWGGAAAGALANTPIAFGSAKTQAIARGADQATADRIGMESAVGNAAIFMLPMHQILAGGDIMTRILKNAAVNAGAGMALSYGQEEIMKANDVRPLPDGSEFNNTLYSTMIGGVTGAIFGAFAPERIAPNAAKFYDDHVGPGVRAQLSAEYIKQGMTPEEADAKAIMDEERSRPAGIQDLQAKMVKAGMAKNQGLQDNYDIVQKEHVPEVYKLNVLDRSQGGANVEIPYTFPDMPPEVKSAAFEVANTALAELKTDKAFNVKTVLDGIPLFKRSTFSTLPPIVQAAMLNDIGGKIKAGLEQGIPRESLISTLVADFKTRKLDSMNPNNHYFLGAHAGEPSDTQNNFWNPVMGAIKISEAAQHAYDSKGLIDPENAKIFHMEDNDTAPHKAWSLFMNSFKQVKENSEFISPKPVDMTAYEQAGTQPTTEQEPVQEQPEDVIHAGPPPEENPLGEYKPSREIELKNELMQDEADRQKAEAAAKAKAVKITKLYEGNSKGFSDIIIQDGVDIASGSYGKSAIPVSGETTPFDMGEEDVTPTEGSDVPEEEEEKEEKGSVSGKEPVSKYSKEDASAVMGEAAQRNWMNTISDFLVEVSRLLSIDKEASPKGYGPVKDYAGTVSKPGVSTYEKQAPPDAVNIAEISSHIKLVKNEIETNKHVNAHQHGQAPSDEAAAFFGKRPYPQTVENTPAYPHVFEGSKQSQTFSAPGQEINHYAGWTAERLMSKLDELENSLKELKAEKAKMIHGATPVSKEMIEDIRNQIKNPPPDKIGLIAKLKSYFDEELASHQKTMEEAVDEKTGVSLWDEVTHDLGADYVRDPLGFHMLDVTQKLLEQGYFGDASYKQEVNEQIAQGKQLYEVNITTMKMKGMEVMPNGDYVNRDGAGIDGKYIMEKHDGEIINGKQQKAYIELHDDHHLIIPIEDWGKMRVEGGPDSYKITPLTSPVYDVIKPGKTFAAQATKEEHMFHKFLENIDAWKNVSADDFSGDIKANTKGLSDDEIAAIAQKSAEMKRQATSVLIKDYETKFSAPEGEVYKPEEISPDNVRSWPLKTVFKVATAFGMKGPFLKIAQQHYGAEFETKFMTQKLVPVTDDMAQVLKQGKYLKDMVHKIALDNSYVSARERFAIATDLTKGLIGKVPHIKDDKLGTVQKVNREFGEIVFKALEENLYDGRPSIHGSAQPWQPNDAPGSPKEWQVKNDTIAGYVKNSQFFGLPTPPELAQGRPELMYTNLVKQLAGDRGYKLIMWMKNEQEKEALHGMIKAGAIDDIGIQANVVRGYTHYAHDLKGVQKEKAQFKGTGSNPTRSADMARKESLNADHFIGNSKRADLVPITDPDIAMREYMIDSMSRANQSRDLAWMRGLHIDEKHTSGMKLTSNDTPEIKNILKNLHHVEYPSSENIVKLAEHTGLDPMAILTKLNYINKKDAEGLVGWDKFSFEKPFMQPALWDALDFYYPKTGMQSEGMSNFTKFANIPKYMLVGAAPLQHTFLFGSSMLANAGPRLPVVLTKWALNSAKAVANMPFAAIAMAKGEAQVNFPRILGGGPVEPGYEGENLHKFLPHGFGAQMHIVDQIFQDQKNAEYIIPEMMSGKQVRDAGWQSSLSALKITFGDFLFKENYNAVNNRYLYFKQLVGKDGKLLMTDDDAARRAVNLVNSTSGVVHAADFGPNGPLYSLMTFARGLTIAPLRVIAGISEPSLRRIYGKDTPKFKIDGFSGLINPISMGDLHPRDADFLQAYYAQHLAKVIALRVLAAGIAQYSLSFLDDDKKDEYGQQGSNPLNKKRFIFNNPEGYRMGMRTPWVDINGRRIMFNPTPFREGEQLVDAAGFEKYHFPESTINWMKNRLNVWEGLIYGAVNGVDIGTGQEIPGKGTDEALNERMKWMLSKVMPLSLGVTEEEKEQRTPDEGAQMANRLGAFLGTTPNVLPKGWQPGYEDAMRIEKEHQLTMFKEKEAAKTMTKQEVMTSQLLKDLSRKQRLDIANGKDPGYNMRKVFKVMTEADKQREKEEQEQLMQTTGQTGE